MGCVTWWVVGPRQSGLGAGATYQHDGDMKHQRDVHRGARCFSTALVHVDSSAASTTTTPAPTGPARRERPVTHAKQPHVTSHQPARMHYPEPEYCLRPCTIHGTVASGRRTHRREAVPAHAATEGKKGRKHVYPSMHDLGPLTDALAGYNFSDKRSSITLLLVTSYTPTQRLQPSLGHSSCRYSRERINAYGVQYIYCSKQPLSLHTCSRIEITKRKTRPLRLRHYDRLVSGHKNAPR